LRGDTGKAVGAQFGHDIQHLTVDDRMTPDGTMVFCFNVRWREVAASLFAVLVPFHPRGQRIKAKG
jgi:hypothetical protein